MKGHTIIKTVTASNPKHQPNDNIASCVCWQTTLMPQAIFDGDLLCSPLALWFYVLTGVSSSFLSLPVYRIPFLQRHFRHAQWRTSCLLTLLLEFWRWAVNCDSWLCVNGNVMSCTSCSYIILYYTSFYIAFIFLILTPEGPHPLSYLCNNNCATNTFFSSFACSPVPLGLSNFLPAFRQFYCRGSAVCCSPWAPVMRERTMHPWLRGLERRWRRQRLRLLLWHTQASDVTRK